MPGFSIANARSNDPDPNVETARKHRYTLQLLQPLGASILVRAHKCGRPSIEFDQLTMHHGQDEVYWPGKNRWLPIEISFYEVLNSAGSDDVASQIYSWWSTIVLNIRQSKLVTGFKRDGQLDMTDGFGAPVWQYKMYGCWPPKVTPDSLDYSSGDIAEITVTIRYDKAEEVTQSARVRAARSSCGPQEEEPAPPPEMRRVIRAPSP